LQGIGSLIEQVASDIPAASAILIGCRERFTKYCPDLGRVSEVPESRANRAVEKRIDLGIREICCPQLEEIFLRYLLIRREKETVASIIVHEESPGFLCQSSSFFTELFERTVRAFPEGGKTAAENPKRKKQT